jgi:outer membrane immunogenic protein
MIEYGWGNGDTSFTPLPTATTFINLAPTTLSPDPSGVVGGVQLGYNWQVNQWLFGVEADFQGSGIDGNTTQSPIIQNNGTPFATSGQLSAGERIDWFGTARGRLGWAAGPWLIYATGGLAYGHVNYSANTDFIFGGCAACVQYPTDFSKIKAGWTAGAGFEWAFAPKWSAKFEYLYVDLGTESATVNPTPANPPFQVAYEWKTIVNIVRLGINYHF